MRKSVLFSALVCAILLVSTGSLFGQSDRSARLAALTSDISQRAAHGRFADSGFVSTAKSRFALMSKLAETDPRAVLDNVLSDEMLARIPANARSYFESRDTLKGELEVVAECEEHDGRIHRSLKRGDDRTSLHFADEPSDDLLTGAEVNTMGVLIGDRMVLEADGMTSASTKTSGETTASAAATGEIKVLVFLINFQNDTRTPYTTAQANNLMFNPANASSVTNYYREASYGQAWVTGDTVGWFTLPMDASTAACDQNSQIATLGRNAATAAGININNYQKHMFVFPNMGCSYSGRGQVGGRDTWIDGSLILRTTAHELGHNLGLYHSKAKSCSNIVDGTCATTEYGHNSDMVGQTGVTGHYHPYQKERLGWLAAGSGVVTVQGAGTYTISGLSVQDNNPKALRIQQNSSTYYYVEFRRPVGFDSFVSSNNNTMNGVLITQNSSSSSNFLLDMVPSTAGWSDAALKVGQSFTDPGTNMTITVSSVSSSGAVVNVSYGSVPCVAAAPTVSADPSAMQWLAPGSSMNYTVTVTNNNSGNCPANTFTVGAAVPAGWTSTSVQVSAASGSSASGIVRVTAPLSTAGGLYSVTLSAANSSHSVSVQRVLSVLSSLSVAASTDQPVYSSGGTVTLFASVSANGSAVAGSTVTFTITKPSSGRKTSTVSATALTGADGRATYSYRLNRKQDPAGSYLVRASSSTNGVSGIGTASFEVR